MYSDYNLSGRSDLRTVHYRKKHERAERGFIFRSRGVKQTEKGERREISSQRCEVYEVQKKLEHMQEGVLTSGQLQ